MKKNGKSNTAKSHTSPLPSKYRYLNGRGDELDERAVNAAKQGLQALDEARLDEAITWFTDAIGYCRSIKTESRDVEAALKVEAMQKRLEASEKNIAVWGDPKGR